MQAEACTPTPTSQRRGAVMVIIMVCLVLATVLLGSVLRMAAVQRRQVRQEQFRVQAEWLAQSGLSRAAARLAAGGDYDGETWTVPAEELGGTAKGEVTIQIETDGEDESRRSIRVQAVYPAGEAVFARRTKQITLAGPAAAADGPASTAGEQP